MMRNKQIQRRKIRKRSKVKSLPGKPRLVVFRSNKSIYGQVIDEKGNVLVSASTREIKESKTKTESAKFTGELLAKKAIQKKINKIIFDRGSYRFHGRVKALAEGARKGGLVF